MSRPEDERRAAGLNDDPRDRTSSRVPALEHGQDAASDTGAAGDAAAERARESERDGDAEREQDAEQAGAAAWICVGLLLGAWVAAPPERPVADGGRPGGCAPPIDPDALSARALRALPGIGPSRALSIVRARWDGLRGGPAAWPQIPGIGAATAAAAARWLEPGRGFEQGRVEPAGAAPYTRPGAP
ncbi:MAG: hypothetical protein JNK02_16005 [Planctomycetes bacterium]|nr:hypothetical protein [Planctomycetota bacterium]